MAGQPRWRLGEDSGLGLRLVLRAILMSSCLDLVIYVICADDLSKLVRAISLS